MTTESRSSRAPRTAHQGGLFDTNTGVAIGDCVLRSLDKHPHPGSPAASIAVGTDVVPARPQDPFDAIVAPGANALRERPRFARAVQVEVEVAPARAAQGDR